MASSIDMTTKHYDMLINGMIVSSSDNEYFESVNPSTGEVFATVTNSTQEDMIAAIDAAKKAYDKGDWRKFSFQERGIYLRKLAGLIRDNAKELADLETKDVGKTSKQSTFIDVPTCADTFDYFGGMDNILKERLNLVDAPVQSITRFEPIGVVGQIIPWNYPLIMTAWKLAPALMAGNSIILKPSPLACVSIMRLAHLIQEAGFPSGVINIVPTKSSSVAQVLVQHEDVNMISFTGGTETGKAIMKTASESLKKVSLELGGKSANIVFADCHFEAAIGGTLSAIFMNQGQMCTAGSRLLLDEKIYDEFLSELVKRVSAFKIGSADLPDTDFGPLISESHVQHCVEFVNKAVQEGAKLLCGGLAIESEKGFYFQPTILSKVTNNMTIAQEECFGPVLSVIKFSDLDEAVRIANDSKYGLAACIWTKDESKPNIIADELQTGTIWVNTYGGFYNQVSFGGYKKSGTGRELGIEGLMEYCQTKHFCKDQTPGGVSLSSSWF